MFRLRLLLPVLCAFCPMMVSPAHAQTSTAVAVASPLASPAVPVPPDQTIPGPAAPTAAPTLSRPHTRHFRFVLGAPTPDLRGFGMLGGGTGTRSMQMQFPVLLDATLSDTVRWGRTYFVSDNLISTDQNDGASRLAIRLGLERPGFVGSASITSEVRYTSNQSGTRQALSASVGTWLPVGPPLWGRRSALGVDLLRFENRSRRSEDRSPHHFARNALIPTLKLRLPPLFLRTTNGKGDVSTHPHLTVGADAWYFANEEAAPGFRPRAFEQFTSIGLIVPQKALGTRLPVVKALAFSYGRGANEANGYANVSNFRANFILGSWEEIRPVARLSQRFRNAAEAMRNSVVEGMYAPQSDTRPAPKTSLLEELMNTGSPFSAP